MTTLHTIIATSVLTTLSVAMANAAPINARYTPTAFSVEAFYGMANKDLLKKDGYKLDETDIVGLNVKYSHLHNQALVLQGITITPEFYGMLSFGQGSEDSSYNVLGYYAKLDAEITTMQLSGGVNLRATLSEEWDVFVGANLGLNYANLNCEFEDIDDKASLGENDIGFSYSIGVGGEYKFAPGHALVLSANYTGSTAQPKIRLGDESYKMEKQSYLLFSVGYKYSF